MVAAAAPEKPNPKVAEVGDDFLGDFVVGERVWVNGVKPGVVQYLGETQFAPGQWAGVVLDDPVGKNDGAVGGVRYFECQALQGIFTRPSKLARQPTAEGSGSDAHSVESLTAQNLSLHSGTATPPLTSRVIPLRESVLNSSVKTGNESGSNLSDSGSVKRGDKDLHLGDRVLVSAFPLPLHPTRASWTPGAGQGWHSRGPTSSRLGHPLLLRTTQSASEMGKGSSGDCHCVTLGKCLNLSGPQSCQP